MEEESNVNEEGRSFERKYKLLAEAINAQNLYYVKLWEKN